MKKGLGKILLVGLTIVGILLGLAILFKPKTSPFIVTSDQVSASKEQKRLIDNFGYPDTFALELTEDNRLEVWNYYGLERSFTFKNGAFINDQIINPLESFNAYPRLRPTQFKKGLSLDETSKIIDSEPTSQAEIITSLIEGAQIYSYSDQVLVGVKDQKVIFIQTLPVKTN